VNSKREHKFKVDISKYNIRLPEEGFFIVTEILNAEYYDKKSSVVLYRIMDRLTTFKAKFTKKQLGNMYSLTSGNMRNW